MNPEAAELARYGGFTLYHQFVAEGRYSPRSLVYIYARTEGTDKTAFTQTTAIHRKLVADRTDAEIDRRLTIDALTRAKHRIDDGNYVFGEPYFLELNEYLAESRLVN